MKWEECSLIRKEKVGEDMLGNAEYSDFRVKDCPGRFTPWANEEVHLEGRDITQNQRKLLLRLPFSDFPTCEKVRIAGLNYEIKRIIDLSPRFVLLHVKAYKEEQINE